MNSIQSLAMWVGHYSNGAARQIGRDLERISRPFKHNAHGYEEHPCHEATLRIKRLFRAMLYAPIAVIGSPLSTGLFALSHRFSSANTRLDIIDNDSQAISSRTRRINIMSLNVCFQEGPFAPMAGGVVSPFDPVKGHDSRVAALVHWIGSQKLVPDIFLGQEFTDFHAQDAFVAGMKNLGYTFFVVDRAPHPVFMNSGLIVASKYKLENISFIPFAWADRYKGDLIVQKGAIECSIANTKAKQLVRILNTHLNCESGPIADATRHRQIRNYLAPRLRDQTVRTVLIGDLNFDTSIEKAKNESGLKGLTNICEGNITWTNEGVAHLRGHTAPVLTENIDAIIPNSPAIRYKDLHITKVATEDGALLSDHYAVGVTLSCV